MEEIVLRSLSEFESVIEEVNRRSEEIPFGNSKFQNNELVVKRNITTGRQLKDGLLSISSRISALREAYYGRQKEDLDIKEKNLNIKKLKRKLSTEKDDIEKEILEIQIERIEIEIEQLLSSRPHVNKIINDAVIEVRDLYESIKQLPEYTREEFESEEKEHITLLYKKELLGISESAEKLMALGVNIDNNQQKLISDETIRKIKGDG